MAGPLHWFRKNQKLMLSVFGVGLIFVFTISLGSGVDPLVDRLSGGGPTNSRDSIAVQWDGGELRERQLEQLRIGRNLLRRFLFTVQQLASQRGGVPRVNILPLYTGDRSLLELNLLSAEAERLGIEVGDEAVLDYLKKLTDSTVSVSEYGELLRQSTGSNLSEADLLDLMARELKAQNVRATVQRGGYAASPVAAWDYYNRLNRLVRAEIMPISVDSYLDEVDDPSEEIIVEKYEKYKDDYPFPLSREPGFRRREQRAFQYVKVDYDAILQVEKAVVTDDEVKKYYEENKEQYRKVSPGDLEETQPEDARAESAANPEPNSDPDPAPTSLPQEGVADPPQQDAADKQPVENSIDEHPAESTTEETDGSAKNGDTVAADVGAGTAEAELATDAEFTADEDEKPAVDPSDDKSAAETTTPVDKEDPASAATVVEPSDLDPVANVEPRYEALADVADDIRQTIARPRAQAKMNAIIDNVERELEKYHNAYTIWDIEREDNPDAERPTPPDVSPFADGDRVVVGEVPLISLLEAKNYEIGEAYDLRFSQQGGVQQIMFADTAFSNEPSLYSHQVIPDMDMTTSRFVYWMTDVKEEYVPDLEEVRSEVVLALKRERAVGLAVKEAKSLAEKARQQNVKLSESLSDRENAEFIDTGEISWMTPSMMEGSVPQPSTIPGAEDASPELREKLFRLSAGEVDYATNMPQTKVYVFRVDDVNPSSELLREQFLRNGANRMVQILAAQDSRVSLFQWYQDLSNRYGVQWKRDPHAGEERQL